MENLKIKEVIIKKYFNFKIFFNYIKEPTCGHIVPPTSKPSVSSIISSSSDSSSFPSVNPSMHFLVFSSQNCPSPQLSSFPSLKANSSTHFSLSSFQTCPSPQGLDNVISISAGNEHTLALKNDGSYCRASWC